MSTQEKLVELMMEHNVEPHWCKSPDCEASRQTQLFVDSVVALIDSAKREVLEEMRPANATIESMRMYTPRTHTYMGKEYPSCSICGFCPEAMNAFIDAQLEQSEESK